MIPSSLTKITVLYFSYVDYWMINMPYSFWSFFVLVRTQKQICGRSWWGYQLYGCTAHHWLMDWLQVNHPKFLLLIIFYISFISGRRRTLHIHWFINITGNTLSCESLIKVRWPNQSFSPLALCFDRHGLFVFIDFDVIFW